VTRMKLRWDLGSARVPRALFGVSPNGKRPRAPGETPGAATEVLPDGQYALPKLLPLLHFGAVG